MIITALTKHNNKYQSSDALATPIVENKWLR